MNPAASIVAALAITGTVTTVENTVTQRRYAPPISVAIGIGVVGFALLALAGPAPRLAVALAWLIATTTVIEHGAAVFATLDRLT